MLTLRSCLSIKFFTSSDKYLNYNFKLNSCLDDITFVYINCIIVIGPEHPMFVDFLRDTLLFYCEALTYIYFSQSF